MEINTKKTVVLGASPNPTRFSYQCVQALAGQGVPVIAIGLREGYAGNIPIQRGMPEVTGIHTVTMYIGSQNQPPYYQYILSLKPHRVIFNPGSENAEFELLLLNHKIRVVHSCTLMMLDYGDF